MPAFTEYAPGTPSWVDLASTDLPGSIAFYGALFGWEAADQGPEAGGYTIFMKDGKAVAGLGPQFAEGAPPNWATYVSVADVEAAVGLVREAGGTVFVEPMDVLDAGRMAVCADPTGAGFSLWQPGAHIGAELANEPGAFCWNELNTRDSETAAAFYGAVFGWKGKTSEGGGGYTELQLEGKSIAGMVDITERVPAEVPAHWMTYFGVESCDAAVATVQELGGSLTVGPIDMAGVGRFAVVTDPQGAHFAVFEMPPGG
ncbi:MAG TPA: VOC family protein [Acidimicrobiales bacterium]|nr:VOC family protein [Acidimicrobiales bacterium]